ncbi:MAG: hypothetical protein VX527_06830, partial [Planctomycetota bacterium]|nr:hypothetical protein [Planctomycetota bacterium]
MRSMSKLICVVAAAAMMFSTATWATAGLGPCDHPLKPMPCNADINESGAVDIDDLLLVVENWGDESNEERPFGDIAPMDNGDCVVDINDLLMVLEHFGSNTSGCGPCGIGEIPDCLGNCVSASWLGDGYCDDGSYSYNGNDIYLNCPEFDCD